MNFIDECSIEVRAGNGGNGCVAFRREANNPRGGPSGGDGGDGGSVVLVADPQLVTLHDLQYHRHYRAEKGIDGQGRDRYGRGGEDIVIRVPTGTLVRDKEGQVLCDLVTPGQRHIVARGGKGGKGNIHFATSTYQAPHKAEAGTEGEERLLRLELKLLADVGLLGFPNVGKSTFISRASRARPKIADYPFTTLTPNLGVVKLAGDRSFVLADVPGLIEGAHQGLGLGHQFLRHLSRAKVLIHLVEASQEPGRDPLHDYEVINRELASFDKDLSLSSRPQIAALTKIDLTETRALLPELQEAFAARGVTLLGISAVTGEGILDLLESAYKRVNQAQQET